MSAQQSNGAKSHLCGSTMNESACSMPSKRWRTEGAARPAPVGPVDVQPQAVLAAHLGDGREVVDDAEVRRAARRDHGEEGLGAVLLERLAQLGTGQAQLVVDM